MCLLLHLLGDAQVGVAGRTGCGKSTLMMALYRLGKPQQHSPTARLQQSFCRRPRTHLWVSSQHLDAHLPPTCQELPPAGLPLPAVEPSSGRIVIDGLDTSSIGLYDLRSRLALVPQASSG
jgi:energy-coupling factor transporter ATP-binding protein EcfA2